MTKDADWLREAFTRYFVERGHAALPAAGLIPHDPSVMFTIAGMVQFKPYFTREQTPPVERATTIQPCFRMVDIDLVGKTARHNTFFEMLGNFSFGDYFKESAIPFAWELCTEVLGFDPDRLWVTVHESDTDASGIWQDVAHLAPERIQALGEPNFWKMGDTGPCGPCSEIYFDRGEAFGAGGGPAHGGEERYVEVWNLVFMQYERSFDGTLVELPKKSIDTGAGLERLLAAIQGVGSVFEIDNIAPLVEEAERLTDKRLGSSEHIDTALRILADHARAMTFLVSDGVFPTNEGRGYVLRRVIRRAVLRAHQLGVKDLVTPELTKVVIATLESAYPKLAKDSSLITTVLAHEEEAFRRTLRAGSLLLQDELEKGTATISGDVAFLLHDTYGFPIDLTVEVAAEHGVEVERARYEENMTEQRERARRLTTSAIAADQDAVAQWKAILEEFGKTRFVGYSTTATEARVLAVRALRAGDETVNVDGDKAPEGAELFAMVLDETPFYAEGGGQVGDTGTLEALKGTFRVLDTKYAIEGVISHIGYLKSGAIEAGEPVRAVVDSSRRDAIRRNHTATHLLQHALRVVLGGHVQQQGSLVARDRLRFDFSHFAPLSNDEIVAVEEIVNRKVLDDESVRTYETTRAQAEEAGAIAFFGEKYGDVVRVVEAGEGSVELCGGTHVSALGMIGPFRILSEGSIGANTRRIEATTGERSFDLIRAEKEMLSRLAKVLRSTPEELGDAAERLVTRDHELEAQLRSLQGAEFRNEAAHLATTAIKRRVVARRDGLSPDALRELALAVRDHEAIDVVGLIGAPDSERVSLVVVAMKGAGIDAKAVASSVARLVGGGGGGSPELATAGGRDVASIEQALSALSSALGLT
jgi:alanyl-tRNA synthetase